ncbi:MAG: zf-HC2 domain-containing protein [Armatimonadia bacterium]
MKCPSEVELNEYAEDRLATRRRWEVQEHLEECAGCRSDLEGLQWTTGQLALLASEAAEAHHPTDEDLAAMAEGTLESNQRARVLTHLGQCPECAAIYGALPRRKRSFVVPRSLSGLAAAAALLLAIGIFYVTGGYRQEPGFAPPPRPAEEMAAQTAKETREPTPEKAAPAAAVAPLSEHMTTVKPPAAVGGAVAPSTGPKPVASRPVVAPASEPSAPKAVSADTYRLVQRAGVTYHRHVGPSAAKVVKVLPVHRTGPRAVVEAPTAPPAMPAMDSAAAVPAAPGVPEKSFNAAAVGRGAEGPATQPAARPAPAAAVLAVPQKVDKVRDGEVNKLVVTPETVDKVKNKSATKAKLRMLVQQDEERRASSGARVRSNRIDREMTDKVKTNVKTKARLRDQQVGQAHGAAKGKLANKPLHGEHGGQGHVGGGTIDGVGKALAQHAPANDSGSAHCLDCLSGGAGHARR